MKLPRVPQPKSSSPEAPTGPLQTIQRKLAQNSLSEFKIGFESGEFTSKKDVQMLIHTIQEKYLRKLATDKVSCLESIRIGWKLPNFALAPVLELIVPMLLQQPAKVQHLQLTLNSWAPLPIIQRLVSWHTLETLDLGSLRIQVGAVSEHGPRGGRTLKKSDQGSPSSPRQRSTSPTSTIKTDLSSDDGKLIVGDDSILLALPFISSSIKTLRLVDCNLTVDHVTDAIRTLCKKRQLKCLSFRQNRRLFVGGWLDDLLDKMPFLRELDLSICDLSPVDGIYLANSLRAHPDARLERLSIAGNYRLDKSIAHIVDACVWSGISELECSHCDISNEIQGAIFELLATKKPCSLRSVNLQGTRISSIPTLIRCIEQNESLECLLLNHPRDPVGVSSESLDLLLAAIRNNYYLSQFKVDLPWRVDKNVVKELEHWLTLNRCGRSILVNDQRRYWPNVIAAIDGLGDIDTLHWLIRKGVEQFRFDGIS